MQFSTEKPLSFEVKLIILFPEYGGKKKVNRKETQSFNQIKRLVFYILKEIGE